MNRFFMYEVQDINGYKLFDNTVINFADQSRTTIEVPYAEPLISFIREWFETKRLCLIFPYKQEGHIFSTNKLFAVDDINICGDRMTIDVINIKKTPFMEVMNG